MNALLVDDCIDMLRLTRKMVSDLGFTVHCASDGAAALEAMEDLEDLELILVDWNMPCMSGVEFIRRVRVSKRFAHVQIVVLTAQTDMQTIEAALDAGANEYIMKPICKQIIREKLAILGVA